MIAYFDSSALVKLMVEEAGSEEAAALWDGADAVVSSRVAYPEVRAGLAAANRDHRLSATQFAEATRIWEELWSALRVVELSAELAQRAGDLAQEHASAGSTPFTWGARSYCQQTTRSLRHGIPSCMPPPKGSALQRFPQRFRRVLPRGAIASHGRPAVYEQRTIDEIAEILKVRSETVKFGPPRSMQQLREALS